MIRILPFCTALILTTAAALAQSDSATFGGGLDGAPDPVFLLTCADGFDVIEDVPGEQLVCQTQVFCRVAEGTNISPPQVTVGDPVLEDGARRVTITYACVNANPPD